MAAAYRRLVLCVIGRRTGVSHSRAFGVKSIQYKRNSKKTKTRGNSGSSQQNDYPSSSETTPTAAGVHQLPEKNATVGFEQLHKGGGGGEEEGGGGGRGGNMSDNGFTDKNFDDPSGHSRGENYHENKFEDEDQQSGSFFHRLSSFLKRNRARIGGLFLGATALTTSTRLWGERLRYDHDIKERDERIQMLTDELQGRFDLEYESLESIKTEKKAILNIVDKFAAEWPASISLDPKTAQHRIASLRIQMETWFNEKEFQLVPQKEDPFVKATTTTTINNNTHNNRNDDYYKREGGGGGEEEENNSGT